MKRVQFKLTRSLLVLRGRRTAFHGYNHHENTYTFVDFQTVAWLIKTNADNAFVYFPASDTTDVVSSDLFDANYKLLPMRYGQLWRDLIG